MKTVDGKQKAPGDLSRESRQTASDHQEPDSSGRRESNSQPSAWKAGSLGLTGRLSDAVRERLQMFERQPKRAKRRLDIVALSIGVDKTLVCGGSGNWATIDSTDWELVRLFAWQYMNHRALGVPGFQTQIVEGGRKYRTDMARLLLGLPDGLLADHVNGDRSDNRRSNIRVVNHQQNSWNSRPHKDSASKFKGIWRSGRRWGAQICANHCKRYLGMYATEEDAARAYDAAAKVLHGEYAVLNFPEEVAA